jgi:hypothetical protein
MNIQIAMPTKNKSKVTDAQRRRIAAGKVVGKTAKTIAAETGLSSRTVEREATRSRLLALVAEYKARDEKTLSQIWDLMIKRLKGDIDSNDPDIRRHARGQFMKLLVLGESATDGDKRPQPGDMTLEELLTVYRMDLVVVGALKR